MSWAGLGEYTKLSESLILYQLGLTGYFNVFVLIRRNLLRCFPIFVLYLFIGAHPLRQTVPCFQLLLFSLFFLLSYHEFSFVFLLLWLYTAFFPRNYLFVYSLDKCLHFCTLNFLPWAHPFEPKHGALLLTQSLSRLFLMPRLQVLILLQTGVIIHCCHSNTCWKLLLARFVGYMLH